MNYHFCLKVKRSLCVSDSFSLLCSQVLTSVSGWLGSGRWFLWCVQQMQLTEQVSHEYMCSTSLLSAPLSCCLLPCCPCQASTTITLAPLITQPFKLRVVPGCCRVAGSGYSSDQQAVAAHRRSCSLQRVLILWFWLSCGRRCCVEERVEGCSWQSGDGFKRLQWSFTWVQANLDKSHWIEGCTPALASGKCVVSSIVLSAQTVCCFKASLLSKRTF